MKENRYTAPCASELCEKTLSILSKGLIGEESKKKLGDFAQLLPQGFTVPHVKYHLIECPLSAGEDWGDISFCFNRLHPFFHDLSILPKAWASNLGWQQLSFFSKACLEDRLLSEQLKEVDDLMGAEFDVGSSPFSYIPSIFFGTFGIKKERFGQVIGTFGSFFQIPMAILALLQKCSDALSKDMCIFIIGFMLSRPGQGCKIVIEAEELTAQVLQEYLFRIGITDYHPELIHVLKSVEPYVNKTRVNFDIVQDQLNPRIGLEFFIFDQKKWKPFLDIVSRYCAMDSDKLSKCFEWNGQDMEFIGNSSHSPHFYLANSRKISHCKLVFMPKAKVQAKAYLQIEWGILEKNPEHAIF